MVDQAKIDRYIATKVFLLSKYVSPHSQMTSHIWVGRVEFKRVWQSMSTFLCDEGGCQKYRKIVRLRMWILDSSLPNIILSLLIDCQLIMAKIISFWYVAIRIRPMGTNWIFLLTICKSHKIQRGKKGEKWDTKPCNYAGAIKMYNKHARACD